MLKWEALREAKHYVWDPSYDLRPRFPDVKAPTLVMGGDRDFFFGLEHAIEAHAGIRDAELCIMPGAGHFANEENPAVFNQVAINFIMRQIRRSRQEGGHHEGATVRP
jgi:pimeloyl-ACP methyl ester carboxylesterase